MTTEQPHVARDNFPELVNLYQSDVRTFLSRFVQNATAADDLAQDVFVTAYRKLDDYNGTGSFKSWLFGMARNLALVYLRGETRRRRREGEFVMASIDRWQAARLSEYDEEAEEHERRLSSLRSCMEALSDENHSLVDAFYFRREKADSIAARLKKSGSAIRMALLRIRRSLGKCVEGKMTRMMGAHDDI